MYSVGLMIDGMATPPVTLSVIMGRILTVNLGTVMPVQTDQITGNMGALIEITLPQVGLQTHTITTGTMFV